MKNILILGAGLSASTLIKYLLERSEKYDWHVVVGDKSKELAELKIESNKNAEAIFFDVFDEQQKKKEIAKADVVVSMLPASFHHIVAEECIKQKKHMVTASYVSEEVKNMDAAAKEAGIAFLNELGVDPGIDHMSAMKVVDEIRNRKGKLLSFLSSTGGLIAPEYDNNPWNYKFTWNPRNVVVAGQGVAQYLKNGRFKYVPYNRLFSNIRKTSVLNVGEFEVYPNRDSLKYRKIYGLEDIPTIFRGTMRRPGYAEAWNVFVQLGMTDDTFNVVGSEEMSYRQFTNTFLPYSERKNVEEKLCKVMNISFDSDVMKKLKWLGIFDDTPIALKDVSPAKILQKILEDKWALQKGDKDMIVMQHEFEFMIADQCKKITSSMVVVGDEAPHTAMSITVGTPVAIATKLLLTGELDITGVHVPTSKVLYQPILNELKEVGIDFTEVEEDL